MLFSGLLLSLEVRLEVRATTMLLSLRFYNVYVDDKTWRLLQESDALRMEAIGSYPTLVPTDLYSHILVF